MLLTGTPGVAGQREREGLLRNLRLLALRARQPPSAPGLVSSPSARLTAPFGLGLRCAPGCYVRFADCASSSLCSVTALFNTSDPGLYRCVWNFGQRLVTRSAGFLRQYGLVVLVGLPAPLTRESRQARKGAAAAGAWATGSGGRGPPLFFNPVSS